jgi:hypothetical protein
MNWLDDNIDALFKKASNEQTFEYHENYWDEFERMLPKKRTSITIAWWSLNIFIGFGIASIIGLTAFSSYAPSKNHALALSLPKNQIFTNTSLFSKSAQKIARHTSYIYEDQKIIKQPEIELLPSGTNKAPLENKLPIIQKNELNSLDISELEFRELPLNRINSNLHESILKFKKPSSLSYYFELSAGMEQAWTKNEDHGQNVNASIGFSGGIQFPIKRNKFSLGIGFKAIQLNDLKIAERTKIYGFNSYIYDKAYQFTSIYCIDFPLSLRRSFGRHTFQLEVIPSINLFSTINKSEAIDGNQTNYSSGVASTELFNSVNLNASLGYGYAINENTLFGLKLGIQTIQPTNSDRFKEKQVQHPISLQFYIKRQLNF